MRKDGDQMRTFLSIAGSDPSGGAGIQADLKTASAMGIYGMSVITALTAQNTMGVKDVLCIDKNFFRVQLRAVLEDIVPDAIKIGMMGGDHISGIIVEEIERFNIKNIVLDPVMVSSSGDVLVNKSSLCEAEALMKTVSLLTPNISEAEILSGIEIKNKDAMEEAAMHIYEKYGVPVLIKGGHNVDNADDFLVTCKERVWFESERVRDKNNHGTGCTLSSAVACNLAKGYDLKQSISIGKAFVREALENSIDIGKGRGPLNHCINLKED